jgi:hypothetical protein
MDTHRQKSCHEQSTCRASCVQGASDRQEQLMDLLTKEVIAGFGQVQKKSGLGSAGPEYHGHG